MYSHTKLGRCIAAAFIGTSVSASVLAMPTALLTRSDVVAVSDAGGRAGLGMSSSRCMVDAVSVFCAPVESLIKGSGFERSGLKPGDRIIAVGSFRPEDLDTEIKLIHSLPPQSTLVLTVVGPADDIKRQITGRMVAASALAPTIELKPVTVEAARTDEVTKFIAKAKAKEYCEHEHSKAIPNAVGGAVGTKVGVTLAPALCSPFLAALAVGDPGIAYGICVLLVTATGTGTGVIIASSTVDQSIQDCTAARLGETSPH